MMAYFDWTPERDARLYEMRHQQLTFREISNVLGAPLVAVRRRMKKLEAKPPVVKRPRNRPSRSKVGARWLPARAQSQTDNRLRRQQGQHADPLGIRAGFATGLWRPKTCQWIAGEPCASDTCKCGAKTKDGLPWCARHFVRIYTGVRAA